MYTMYSDVYYV